MQGGDCGQAHVREPSALLTVNMQPPVLACTYARWPHMSHKPLECPEHTHLPLRLWHTGTRTGSASRSWSSSMNLNVIGIYLFGGLI